MKCYHLLLAFTLLVFVGQSAHAKIEFEMCPGVGYLTGSNTYEIGNVPPDLDPWGRDPYFPVSKLDFLLNVYVATFDAKFTYDKLSISGGIRTNFMKDSGKMRDYDWGIPFWDDDGDEGPGWYVWVWTDGTNEWYALDIESKSKNEVNALLWEANLAYQIFSYQYKDKYHNSNYRGYLGIGYEHRGFEYECKLIRQWSPSELSGFDYIGDGSVGLTYDVSYSIPYAEFSIVGIKKKLYIEMIIGYSPYARAKDKDVHLIRIPGPIYAEGDCTGQSLKYAAVIQYNFAPNWSAKLVFDHIYIRAKGEQDKVLYAGSDNGISWDDETWTTDERIISRESYFTFNVAYRFNLPD